MSDQAERRHEYEFRVAMDKHQSAMSYFLKRLQVRAEAVEAERDALHKLCPICGHEWSRHDPEDGRCDAGPPCGCGRNLEGMQARIAQLSKAALAGMPAPKPEPVDMPRIQDTATQEEKIALHKRVQELSDALEDLHDAIEARADSGKRRALTVSPKMEKSLLKARAALKGE